MNIVHKPFKAELYGLLRAGIALAFCWFSRLVFIPICDADAHGALQCTEIAPKQTNPKDHFP